MKNFILILLLSLCNCVFVKSQDSNCPRVYISVNDFVLVYNPNGSEISLTEPEASFLKKAGKPDKVESGKDALEEDDTEYLLYKRVFYGESNFTFHYKGGGNDYEGLRDFRIYDSLFSIKDKRRNVSLKVGDGLEELKKFKPGYSLSCEEFLIYFIVNGKKQDGSYDDAISVFVNRKTKKITYIGSFYRNASI